jgi:LuxR family quorum sensing-dependent transcriptional regulator
VLTFLNCSKDLEQVQAMPTQLAADLLSFTEAVGHLDMPEAVLDALDAITWRLCHAHVLGAALLPLNFGTADSLIVGKTVFLHESVPKGWWEDRTHLAARSPAPSDVAARLALAPFTLSELMKSLEPIGVDRWAIELNLKHGIRDLFGCPMGGRWIFVYWSPKIMQLPQDQRALLYLGAAFATTQLQKLAPPFTGRLGKGASLTPRELSVLRSLSLGYRVAEISRDLGLGKETVRSHIKKAQTKLNVRNPMHAVAQAMRMRLIP